MAIELDGVNEKITFSNTPNVDGSGITLALRFNMIAEPNDTNHYLIHFENGAQDLGLLLWLRRQNGATGEYSLSVSHFTSGTTKQVYTTENLASRLTTGTWYDVIATIPWELSASNINIYLDGTLETNAFTQNGTGTLDALNGNTIIGGRVSDELRNFNGRIADVGVYTGIWTTQNRTDFGNGIPPGGVTLTNLDFQANFLAGSLLDQVNDDTGSGSGTPVSFAHPTLLVEGVSATYNLTGQDATLTKSEGDVLDAAQGTYNVTGQDATLIVPNVVIDAEQGVYNVTGQAADLNPIQAFDYFECGNTDTSRMVFQNATTATPTITMYGRPGQAVEGGSPDPVYYDLLCGFRGLNGKTPTFKLNLDDSTPNSQYGGSGFPVGWRAWFTYDSPWLTGATWTRMANTSVNGNFQDISHSAAFNQDTVYIATRPIYSHSMASSLLDSIKSNQFVSSPSSATDYVYGSSAATTRDGDGSTVPSLDLLCARITNTGDEPSDNTGKRICVCISDQHASEHQAGWQLQGFVNYLLGGTGTATALLRDWDFYIYFLVNPSGRWGSAYRGTLQAGEGDEDPNRDWPGGATAGLLNVITTLRNAITTDTSNDIDCFLDFHGRLSQPDSIFRDANRLNDRFISNVNTYHTVLSVQFDTAGAAAVYYGNTLNVPVSVTPEGAGYVTAVSDYEDMGPALAQALNDSFLDGDFQKIAVGQYTLSGQAATLTASNAVLSGGPWYRISRSRLVR